MSIRRYGLKDAGSNTFHELPEDSNDENQNDEESNNDNNANSGAMEDDSFFDDEINLEML